MASACGYGNNPSMKKTLSFAERGGWWVVAQALILSGAAVLPVLEAGGVFPAHPLHRIGWLTVSVGMFIVAAAVQVLEPRLTPFPFPRPDAKLETQGIYAYVRHPIYVGIMVACVGWAVVWLSDSAVLYALAVAIFFDLKAAREEAWLRERFQQYEAYAKRVRRFIPGIY